MGGNVVILKNGKKYNAQKIPIKKIGLQKFKKDVFDLIKKINDIYEKRYNSKIWKNLSLLDTGELFNGSTSFMFASGGENLIHLKPEIGDIDLITPEEVGENLWELLKDFEGKKITSKIKYIGNNKPFKQSIGDQINALFLYIPENIYFQIDFELEKFENDKPSVWTRFSHSSTVEDLKENIKGVFSRYLERAMTRYFSKKEAYFVTSKATCENWEKKLKKVKGKVLEETHIIKFSLKGLRVAFKPLECDGKIVEKNGKIVFKEISTKNSEYIRDLKTIFEMFFNKIPTDEELKLFWSFTGKIELMKKYLKKKDIEEIFNEFLALLWENNEYSLAQEIERFSPEKDFDVKIKAVNYFLKQFPYLKKIYLNWKDDIENYYKKFYNKIIEIIDYLSDDEIKRILKKMNKNINENKIKEIKEKIIVKILKEF